YRAPASSRTPPLTIHASRCRRFGKLSDRLSPLRRASPLTTHPHDRSYRSPASSRTPHSRLTPHASRLSGTTVAIPHPRRSYPAPAPSSTPPLTNSPQQLQIPRRRLRSIAFVDDVEIRS